MAARAKPTVSAAAGDLLSLCAVSADGVGVLADGTITCLLETEPVNPLVMSADTVEHTSRRFAGVLACIPAGQGLAFYVHSQPLDAGALTQRLRERADAAGRAVPAARGRALRRLAHCEAHSILARAGELAATQLRYLIAVPLRPARGLPRPRRAAVTRTTAAAHERALSDHGRYRDQILAALGAMNITARQLKGGEVADLLWERFSPDLAAGGAAAPSTLEQPVYGALEDPADEHEAAALAGYLQAVVCGEPIAGHNSLRIGGGLEQVLAVSSVPDHTWLGWVAHLMQTPLPFTLVVHVHATDRHRERVRQRRRYKRLYGVNRGSELRGRLVDPQAQQREDEAAQLNHKLATSAGAGIYEVATYLALRQPDGDPRDLRDQLTAVANELVAVVDAYADTGRFNQRRLWQSTLPLGHDAARRTRRYVTDNAADTIPLVGTRCGSPDSATWLPLGYAHPGRTLEGLDPFDPAHPNHLLVVCGQSGGGKTMTTNLIVARCLARGAQGTIIDRAGHYDFLASLIPDGARIALGAGQHTINPWDGTPTSDKVTFLLRLHELLVGAYDQRVDSHGLDVLQRAALEVAIRRVYRRCQLTGEAPREAILQEELVAMHHQAREDGASDHASTLRLLAEALGPYVHDGLYAYLADRSTTIPAHAPLLVFDTRQIGDSEAPAALFCICEQAVRRVGELRGRHLAGDGDGSPWAGKSLLVIDEAWKLLARRATGMWVNELARRSRHLALFMVAISQQLSDFKGEEGAVLLSQSAMRLFLAQQPDQLPYIQQALGLCDEELAAIGALQTTKRAHATCFLANGSRGRGTLTLAAGALEYWIATSDPVGDEPVRQAALRQADGDPWQALALLADPDWHAQREAA